MEWRTVRFDWNHARAFLVTAEEGSLSAAARALGMAQPTLGRQVSALEQELGAVLFERVGGKLVLTVTGEELLEHVREMGAAATRLSLSADGQSQQLSGKVSISVSEVYAAFVLPPVIARLRTLEPGISIEIIASNDESDLTRREADLALRNYRPTQPDLIARKLCDDSARLYAAADYLDSLPREGGSLVLDQAKFVAFADPALIIEWLNGAGIAVDQEHFPLATTNYLVHWEMVRQGLGIGIMPEAIGDQEPGVRRAFPEMDPFVFPVWLVSHRELRTSRRVRTVFDLLVEELSR
ncbi:MAG: LysR family transcriptional regulator [Burkholderiaceae bacterium]